MRFRKRNSPFLPGFPVSVCRAQIVRHPGFLTRREEERKLGITTPGEICQRPCRRRTYGSVLGLTIMVSALGIEYSGEWQ